MGGGDGVEDDGIAEVDGDEALTMPPTPPVKVLMGDKGRRSYRHREASFRAVERLVGYTFLAQGSVKARLSE